MKRKMNKNLGNKQEIIESQVDRTLSLMDEHHKSVDVSPYFYTRLMGRINSEESGSIFQTLKGALVLPALLALMLIFNLYTWVYAPDTSTETNTTSITSETVNNEDESTYDVSSFSEEYNLNGGRY